MKQHSTYDSIEAIAQDQSFIHWVKEKDSKSGEFWLKWAEENPSSATWLVDARAIVESIYFEKQTFKQSTIDNLWQRIDNATEDNHSVSKKTHSLSWLKIAASFALILTAGWWWVSSQAPTSTFATAQKEQLAIDLPDNSIATLNADSKLDFNEDSWSKSRELSLEGEAFFEVEKGSKFTVQTKLGKVEVLGTSFNVYAREDAFEIKCYTGKVSVTDHRGTIQVLTPGQMLTISDNEVLANQFVPDKKQLWVKGYFLYQEDHLGKIFDEMERQFAIKISASDKIRNISYTGFFEKTDLEQALEAVCWPVRLKFDIQNKKVTIKEE